MRVLCFCGSDYTFEGDIGPCPNCDRIATTGQITESEAQALICAIVDAEIAGVQGARDG